MLKNWQEKYPKIFSAHPHIMSNLKAKEHNLLATMLAQIAEHELLNEQVVDYLLTRYASINEYVYLVEQLIRFDSLNKSTLHYLLNNNNLNAMAASVQEMDGLSILSAESLKFLLSASEPEHCVTFIKRALHAKVDLGSIQSFLSAQIAMSGLSRAITLFDHSALAYTKAHFNIFALLTLVLANPLCQTMFDARLRCFSDYSMPSDPLKTPKLADSIIHQLTKLSTQEEQVAAFCNFFTEYRPFPASQVYLVEIDVAEKVTFALTAYCQAMVNAIISKQDYIKAKQLIQTIITEGGNKELFDAIKYEIASSIENEDMCSLRTYQQHMDDIWHALKLPQSTMDNFAQDLKKSKGYQAMMTASMQGHALLMPASAAQAQESMQELAAHP